MDNVDLTNKEIVVHEAVAKLTYFAKLYGIESLFIVGGFCREWYYDRLWAINDIDVASAFHEQALQLGSLFASEVMDTTMEVYKRSGAGSVLFQSPSGEVKVEFQGHSINQYMYNQEVRDWMHSQGIEDVPLMNNIYGRDFTINALIYSLNDESVYDPTHLAMSSLKDKQISSLLPPEMLVKYNPLAILRGIRFAVQYDFNIEPDLRVAFQKGHDNLCKMVSQDRIIKEIVRILKIDAQVGFEMLKKYNLSEFLLTPDIKRYLKEIHDEND